MASLLGRLRIRPDRRPNYTADDSDDDDDDDFVQNIDQTTEQVEGVVQGEVVNPLADLENILDYEMRPTATNDPDSDNVEPKQVFVKQYFVKWKGLSYLHCTWVPEEEFQKAYKFNHWLKTRVNKFHCKRESMSNNGDDFVAIRPEWTTADRILACREGVDGKEYLVKYKELSYDECYWEYESEILGFEKEIQRFNDINSGSRRDKYVQHESDHNDFRQFDHTPEFLTGSLHEYQLEGLNFLRFSWSNRTHVILADEMGLGKTVQSIAFLASLFEENLAPYLVVAPLSTLRNWEREFATWAPHMNVVMYVGNYRARSVIRKHEFYFPKGHNNKSGESKQERIKFDVLLTSYEMINSDTTVLKPIKWKCMIVDEGHRLKNKDSKLFSSLKQFTSEHRVLLTGTPLQNNLDELFVLMHFLDTGKFGKMEEFQEQFKEINQEEQISRLHKMLAPHLLRRVKKDVLKDMPSKKELILRVDLSNYQKEIYKAIITKSYKILCKRGAARVSNVLTELRKVCLHPYMVEAVLPEFGDANEAFRQLVEASGKLQLLDKMMVKLREQGHRVLIYTQFQHMLDLLEDYCTYKNWFYERIDGKVSGAKRQVRIDRFNAENSNRFCFLLSTRAGGLGINLATADTVIIYDSDWNPHADLQAMARAHRIGQTNKVMIYRLINRGTVEERMMQMTKKKMLLEHLVVGKLKAKKLSQEELDDIIRYGSKELFSEENEGGSSGKINYDDAAIEKLLDRDHVDAVDDSVDDEKQNEFLKAFKVANFECVDENEAAASEEAQSIENKSLASSSNRVSYWQELLKDKYEVHQAEELNALGKRKRNCKQILTVEEDDLAGLEVSSDRSYEAESSDDEVHKEEELTVPPQEIQIARRPYRRRAQQDNSKPAPLIEGEGKYMRVLGFNQRERHIFSKTIMRYGVGDYDWKKFVLPLKNKTIEELNKYGELFLKHISHDSEANSLTYSDGVPKEGVKRDQALVRIAVLTLVKEKLKYLEDNPTKPLFSDRTIARFPGLKSSIDWKEEHDKILFHAVSKHGYAKWQNIVDDTEFKIQEIICKEIHYDYISLSDINAYAGVDRQKWLERYKDLQKRIAYYVRRRFQFLETAMNFEHAEEYYEQNGSAEQVETRTKVMDVAGPSSVQTKREMLLKTKPITSQESTAAVVDHKKERLEMAQRYYRIPENLNENSEPKRMKLGDSPDNVIELD